MQETSLPASIYKSFNLVVILYNNESWGKYGKDCMHAVGFLLQLNCYSYFIILKCSNCKPPATFDYLDVLFCFASSVFHYEDVQHKAGCAWRHWYY